MVWPYSYTPYVWPLLASAAILVVLIPFTLRRRSVTGALPFAAWLLFSLLWLLGNALELLAAAPPLKIVWVKFQDIWLLPLATGRLCFALEYTGFGRWLTHRRLILLAVPPLLMLLLILTNDAHHLIWSSSTYSGYLSSSPSHVSRLMVAYGYLTVLVVLAVLAWRFVHSPRRRWPVGLIFGGQLLTHLFFLMQFADQNPFAPLDPTLLGTIFNSLISAAVLFGFRMFDPIKVARATVIEQMREGMLVLDAGFQVIDWNTAAESIFRRPGGEILGRSAGELLPGFVSMTSGLDGPGEQSSEARLSKIRLENVILENRAYTLHLSPLKDRKSQVLGSLLLLSDITEQKRAQAQVLEQQRALAMLSERERLARELHDSIGQVLGYAGFQIDASRKLIEDGQVESADHQLERVGSILREAHADVREYILNLRAAPSEQQPFFDALRHYLDGYCQNYDIQTDLSVEAGIDEALFAPGAQMQLFRIIQEGLSNVRKHSGAKGVRVVFDRVDGLVRITIQDDGYGFNPAQAATGAHYGLRFMRERIGELGGSIELQSAPGKGTRILVEVPANRLREKDEMKDGA